MCAFWGMHDGIDSFLQFLHSCTHSRFNAIDRALNPDLGKSSSTMIKFAKSSRIVEKSRKFKQMQSQGEMKGNLISIFDFIRYTENSYDHRVKLYPTRGKNCCSVNNSLQNIK